MRSSVRWASWAVIAVLSACQPAADPNPAAAQAEASLQTAPDCSFIDQTGAKRRLSDFKGKFIVLTEWAEWCPHCQAQLPKIQKDLYQPYADKGIAFVNVEASRGTAADVAAFASKLNVTMPLYHDDGDSTKQAYPLKGFPTTTFITPSFRILETKSGETPTADYVTYFKPYLKP